MPRPALPEPTRTGVAALALAAGLCAAVPALAMESVYTRVSISAACAGIASHRVGGTWSCPGHAGYGVLVSEGDLRMSVFYGYVGAWYGEGAWESFGPFNAIGETVEWRIADGVPRAAILRWFIDNMNPETGAPDPAIRGQVLVISRVAQPGEGKGCVVGYVDARANADANALARQVGDDLAGSFVCRQDEPSYHGAVGPTAAEPVRAFGQ
ncbi:MULTISPECIES: hypothetical protein [unclassified Roseitalea]|uniref:hypothetical protein n=1 Tax=unclassified Roseitalea TaxID=2639107 RepID=UPI00273E2F6A|nr:MULTISPECIES: hypothetical protein [unclassified Roseitalea]